MGRARKGRKITGVETKTASYRQEEGEGPNTPLYPPKLRDCRRCGIRTHNYYACYRCQLQIMGRSPDAYFSAEVSGRSGDLTDTGLGVVRRPGQSAAFHRLGSGFRRG